MSMDMISSLLVPGMACRKSASAAVAVLVGEECPYLAVAQTGLVEAHVRSDIGGVEVKPTTEFMLAPLGITAQSIAV